MGAGRALCRSRFSRVHRLPPRLIALDAMLLGSERLIASQRLNGLRVGVLANPASVDHHFGHVVDRLGASSAWRLAVRSTVR